MIIITKVDQPLVLLTGSDPIERGRLTSWTRDYGRRALEVEMGDIRPLEQVTYDTAPSLLLFMPDLERDAMVRQAHVVRALGCGVATVPIVALSSHASVEPVVGVDGAVDVPRSAAVLGQILDQWAPHDPMAKVRSLIETFGAPQIMPLVASLRAELDAAIGRLDTGGDRSHAHRIAGVAGTLGFGSVSDNWLRLSEQDETAMSDARRTARIAIAAIDRAALNAPRLLDHSIRSGS